MFGYDTQSRVLAEKLEKIFKDIEQEEYSGDRKRRRDELIPIYNELIERGGETESYRGIMHTISEDSWTIG